MPHAAWVLTESSADGGGEDVAKAAAVAATPVAPMESAEKLETLAKPPKFILANSVSSGQLGTN
jgi:hypothetical protein